MACSLRFHTVVHKTSDAFRVGTCFRAQIPSITRDSIRLTSVPCSLPVLDFYPKETLSSVKKHTSAALRSWDKTMPWHTPVPRHEWRTLCIHSLSFSARYNALFHEILLLLLLLLRHQSTHSIWRPVQSRLGDRASKPSLSGFVRRLPVPG